MLRSVIDDLLVDDLENLWDGMTFYDLIDMTEDDAAEVWPADLLAQVDRLIVLLDDPLEGHEGATMGVALVENDGHDRQRGGALAHGTWWDLLGEVDWAEGGRPCRWYAC